eukprot:gene3422-3887_t
MFKQLALLAVFVAVVASQATCNTYTGYTNGYTSLAFNFLRHDFILSFAEAGEVAVDVTNQRAATFFRISYNDTRNIPIFESGIAIHFASNQTEYFITNGLCFYEYNPRPILNTLVPSNAVYRNQVTVGSKKFNAYNAPYFDGQHAFFGVFEPTTCIPVTMTLNNVDETLGVMETQLFEFQATTPDASIFELPDHCFHPRAQQAYPGIKPSRSAYSL